MDRTSRSEPEGRGGRINTGLRASPFGHLSSTCCTSCTLPVSLPTPIKFSALLLVSRASCSRGRGEYTGVLSRITTARHDQLTSARTGLCQRRQWPEPYYEVTPGRHGYTCVVRVNNREYQTSGCHATEVTSKEAAATVAFNICRSFSVCDGMYPQGFAHDNIVQGRAVPVGAGRSHRQSHASNATQDYRTRTDSISSGSRSGGSSPDHSDESSTSLYDRHIPRETAQYGGPRQASSRHYRHNVAQR